MSSDKIIRKISIGQDYLNSMSYSLGQTVVNGKFTINRISKDKSGYSVFVKDKSCQEFEWKQFPIDMPISEEYKIDFDETDI